MPSRISSRSRGAFGERRAHVQRWCAWKPEPRCDRRGVVGREALVQVAIARRPPRSRVSPVLHACRRRSGPPNARRSAGCRARPRRGTGTPAPACRRRSPAGSAARWAARRRRVCGRSFISNTWPTMFGSPPNLVAPVGVAERSAPLRRAGHDRRRRTNVRPRIGLMPSRSKKLADTTPVLTRSGSPRFSRSKFIWWYSTRPSNTSEPGRDSRSIPRSPRRRGSGRTSGADWRTSTRRSPCS